MDMFVIRGGNPLAGRVDSHLRQLLRVTAEDLAGVRNLWIGFFPDRLSRYLTFLSIAVLPVGAVGAYLFFEAFTYGSMFMPWDPWAPDCCSPVRVWLAAAGTGALAVAAGYCALTLRRVRRVGA